ncbi:hypothetical protein BTVI_36163 [Pitangus sulphuratus]|nr:hypothetical protein BTVI_36163 [Pitangus sulphuratus]
MSKISKGLIFKRKTTPQGSSQCKADQLGNEAGRRSCTMVGHTHALTNSPVSQKLNTLPELVLVTVSIDTSRHSRCEPGPGSIHGLQSGAK